MKNTIPINVFHRDFHDRSAHQIDESLLSEPSSKNSFDEIHDGIAALAISCVNWKSHCKLGQTHELREAVFATQWVQELLEQLMHGRIFVLVAFECNAKTNETVNHRTEFAFQLLCVKMRAWLSKSRAG